MRPTKWTLRTAAQAACLAALPLLASCGSAARQPTDGAGRSLPPKVEVLPSGRVYRPGEEIRIRIRLVNPTDRPVTVVVFENALNGRGNWWPEDWAKANDEYVLPDGTTRSSRDDIPLPPRDEKAEFVTIRPGEAYEESHAMVAKVPGKWKYRVCFSVLRNRIYAGAYCLPPMPAEGGNSEKVESFWKEWSAKGYVRADESPYLVMKVNPDVTLGTAPPAEARIEVRRR